MGQHSVRLDDETEQHYKRKVKQKGGTLHSHMVKDLKFSKDKKHHISKAVKTIFEAIQLPKILRMNSSSTTFDRDRILAIIRNLEIERLFFGVRSNKLNKSVVVFVAETNENTFLFDTTLLNMARSPRDFEIADIFKVINEQGDFQKLFFFSEVLPDTEEMEAAQAIKEIFKTETHSDFFRYIKLLSSGLYDKELFEFLQD